MGRRAILFLDVAVKVAVIALLLHAVANPDVPQYSGKAMLGRALAFQGDLTLGTLGGALGAAIVGLTSQRATGSRSPRA